MYKNYKEHKEKYPNLGTYLQLGFVPISENSGQVIGDCVFCGAEKKLYVNKETKAFDCKVCSMKGGFETFCKSTITQWQKNCTVRDLSKLATLKKVNVDILQYYNFGYDKDSDRFILPIMDDKNKLKSMRIFTQNKFMNVGGFSLYPFGISSSAKKNKTWWVTEGEWDKFALEDLLAKRKMSDSVISIPGAGTFKEEWIPYFSGKNIIVCYDNDEAGKKGATRIYNLLSAKCDSLQFLNWPEGLKDGYDLRDFCIDNASDSAMKNIKVLKSYLKDLPMPYHGAKIDAPKSTEDKKESILESYDGEFIEPEKVYSVYKKWLHMDNTEVLDVLFGTIIANRYAGEPLWLFLVATSGGSKTELLTSLNEGPNIVTTSSMTPKSLISGAQTRDGSDPSLIPKLDGKVLLIKDFTVMLKNNESVKDELFGILRDAYDGKIEKDFGSGVHRAYTSKFGIIAAVTNAIDQFTDGESALGERFLKFRISITEDPIKRLEYIRRAQSNSGKELEMRQELSDIGKAVISYAYEKKPEIPKELTERIIMLSQFIAMMRATVQRDKFHKDHIIYAPSAELGTRLSKQFNKLLLGIGAFKGESTVSESTYVSVKNIGISSISKIAEMIISYMYKTDKEDTYETKDFKGIVPITMNVCERQLEDLSLVGVLNSEYIDGERLNMKKRVWSLTEGVKYLIREGKLYE
jgi:hypothetical protein